MLDEKLATILPQSSLTCESWSGATAESQPCRVPDRSATGRAPPADMHDRPQELGGPFGDGRQIGPRCRAKPS